jgi:hypothetical protein
MTINAIKRVVPSAGILSNVGAELEMVLNKDAAKSFETLFLDLESKFAQLTMVCVNLISLVCP